MIVFDRLSFIDGEMAKKKGKRVEVPPEEVENELQRAEDELYKIPDHLKVSRLPGTLVVADSVLVVSRPPFALFLTPTVVSLQVKKRNSEESSTQWTTGIAEVQLPIE